MSVTKGIMLSKDLETYADEKRDVKPGNYFIPLKNVNSYSQKETDGCQVEEDVEDDFPAKSTGCLIGLRSMSFYSQIRELNKKLSNVYASTVSIPELYTENKHNQSRTLRNFCRKISGIPFALVYGIAIIYIVSHIIIGKPKTSLKTYSDLQVDETAKNICEIFMAAKVNSSTTLSPGAVLGTVKTTTTDLHNITNITNNFTQYSEKKRRDTLLFDNLPPHFFKITMTVMGALAIYSVTSRNTRATMFLILPGIITRHSRHLIFTIVLGFLVNDGPFDNLKINFNKLLGNAAHMYRSVIVMACIKEKEFVNAAKQTYNTFARFNQLQQQMQCAYLRQFGLKCAQTTLPPFSFTNSILDTLKSLSEPTTQAVKMQTTVVLENVGKIGSYLDVVRKVFTVLTLIILIIDAVRYLRCYYTDSSFDNMYVSKTARKRWKKKSYYKISRVWSTQNEVLPEATQWDEKRGLRKFEKKEGFKSWNIPKLNTKSGFKVIHNSITTIIFILLVIIVLASDYFLAVSLRFIKENQNLSLHIDLTNASQILKEEIMKYDTKSSFATPVYTSARTYIKITLYLCLSMLSCVFQIFIPSIRASLCNLLYPDRKQERADYLHYRLMTGRLKRKCDILLIIRRELERRSKLIRFSPLRRLKKVLNIHDVLICAGCPSRIKLGKAKVVTYDVNGKRKEAKICEECFLDYRGNNNDNDNMWTTGEENTSTLRSKGKRTSSV